MQKNLNVGEPSKGIVAVGLSVDDKDRNNMEPNGMRLTSTSIRNRAPRQREHVSAEHNERTGSTVHPPRRRVYKSRERYWWARAD